MKTHGMRRSPTWYSWRAMLERCLYSKNSSYPYYGGRGIKVCNRWLRFENFLADMGVRPLGTTIERNDRDGHYEPSNCRWATASEQQSNKRSNRLLTFRGQTKTQRQWAFVFKISETAICKRLNRGWTIKAALTTPLRKTIRRAA